MDGLTDLGAVGQGASLFAKSISHGVAKEERPAVLGPSWWKEPAWTDGPERWRVAGAGGAVLILGTAFALLLGRR